MINSFNDIDGLSCIKPEGAFYVFVSCSGVINKKTPEGTVISNDVDFANYLLEYAGVAVVPGAAFGKSPYFRVSYAASMDLLIEACKKIRYSISLMI